MIKTEENKTELENNFKIEQLNSELEVLKSDFNTIKRREEKLIKDSEEKESKILGLEEEKRKLEQELNSSRLNLLVTPFTLKIHYCY